MKRKSIIIIMVLAMATVAAIAQTEYRRSSLYSLLLQHPEQEFFNEITQVFSEIPVPDKFDDHNLSVRVINASLSKGEKTVPVQKLADFLTGNQVPKRMVSKWFNRDRESGLFDMQVIAERGLFDASAGDIALARASARGRAMLEDAGEELIGNTFILVNDIRYVDMDKRGKNIGKGLRIVGTVAQFIPGVSDVASYAIDIASKVSASVVESMNGFGVTVTSHLFRLKWDEDIASVFYDSYYMDENSYSSEKADAYNAENALFTLHYVGSQEASSSKTKLGGVNNPSDMIRKVCTRAIDEAIVKLQHNHDEFRVKTPLTDVEPLQAQIGVKEGISEQSQFEVLERVEDENGRIRYKRAGIIRPQQGMIWDNRYMADADEFANASLGATHFVKVSGSDFYTGMLIREIK